MRPSITDPFFVSIRTLAGVGPKISTLLKKLLNISSDIGEPRLVDLLHLMPTSLIDRRNRPGVAFAVENEIVTLDLIVDQHQAPQHYKKNIPYRVYCHDNTSEIVLVFFHAQQAWIENALPIGASIIASGKVEHFNGQAQMVHPDHIVRKEEAQKLLLIEPVYPLTAGLSSKTLSRALLDAVKHIPILPEWLDENFKLREKFPTYKAALEHVHAPQAPQDIELQSPTRRRLAYDEFLAGQLALGLVRAKTKHLAGLSQPSNGKYLTPFKSHLPFELTKGQKIAISEISDDLASPQRMLRLLQGDVGSGKTIVALYAMLQAAENGAQSALMSPTEVLAKQHFTTLAPLLAKIGLKAVLLTGREKGKERQAILESIKTGSAAIIIGTHALIQEKVDYYNLSLAIIDEQHRFGVHQRLQLTAKGLAPDMLVMTATPIPRTLVLTAFGDMDVSKLQEKPKGRKPIQTATLPLERLDKLLERIDAALNKGDKIYWVCPLVEESEVLELTSATDRFESLKKHYGNQVGLVHGKMAAIDKDAAMEKFKNGELRLLVATTVVEVGVDVPDASIIIIEHAERFGLAQLHQLRGRVGRGDKESSCILLYKNPLSLTAKARLNVMRETQDGFIIAEEDLRLRGEGELLGTKQSGVPGFELAHIESHRDLLEIARQDARLILTTDSDLTSPRGQALRLLLYIFRRDEVIRLLRAG